MTTDHLETPYSRRIALWVLRLFTSSAASRYFIRDNSYSDRDVAQFLGLPISHKASELAKVPKLMIKMLNELEARGSEELDPSITENLAAFSSALNLNETESKILEFYIISEVDSKIYEPRGSTALLDAIVRAIKALGRELAKEPEEKRPGKVIIAIYTDGEENASTEYTLKEINEMITHQRQKYNWELMFLAANQDAIATATQMGIDRSMASVSEFSPLGVSSSSRTFRRKTTAMRKMMATGEMDEDYHKSIDKIREEEEQKRDA